MVKEKIGILGGTFNPIHNGHLMLAKRAFEFCDLSKVLIMPSGCSYLKDQSLILPKMDRINMVKLAIQDYPYFELSELETNKEGNSYTYETLTELVSKNPNWQLFYIIGADTLFSIETWKEPQVIFNNSTIVAARRDHKADNELFQKIKSLTDKYNCKIILLDSEDMDVSSSDIRYRIKNGLDADDYLPEKVSEYIKDRGFYK